MMPFRISCVAFLCMTAASAIAQTPEQLFQHGNMLYQQGRLSEARESYEKILAGGSASGELFYNLGNTYYKTGDISLAILNYERALRYLPQDDDLRHNLQLANLLITDRIEPAPRLFIWDAWDGVKNAFSLNAATWLAYVAFLLVFASMTFMVLSRTYRLKKIALFSTVGSAVLFVFFLVVFLARLSDFNRTDEAILTAAIATVKNSPDARSSDAFVLHGGVKVRIIDAVSEWIEIRLADGKVGWVEKNSVVVI